MPFLKSILCIAFLSITLTGCFSSSSSGSSSDPDTDSPTGGAGEPESLFLPVTHEGQDKDQIDVVISGEDGTDIHATVFFPALAEDEPAPLVIHSHGWGGSRLNSLQPDDSDSQFMGDPPAEAAYLARENGAIVVSYDQRGFGDSGGKAALMDPAQEGQDFIALVDYLESEFDHLLLRDADDGLPRVATLGLSYGGGFQWVASSVDERVDAIVPFGTWYDLSFSLHAGDVPKSTWVTLLLALGIPGAEGALDASLYKNATRMLIPGKGIEEEFLDQVATHGIRDVCERRQQDASFLPTADALIIQGVEDTLFNMNEAVDAFDCLKDRPDADTHLFVQRTGHVAPIFEQSPGPIGFGAERRMDCGDERYVTSRMMFDFVESRLRKDPEALTLPRTCMTLEDRPGLALNDIPRGGLLTLEERKIFNGLDDPLAILAPLDILELLDPTNLPDSLLNTTADLLDRLSPQTTIPLYEAQGEESLAGIPTLEMDIDVVGLASAGVDPTFFVGLQIKRNGERSTTLIHNQVTPIQGQGPQSIELPGVTQPLEPGDEIALAIYLGHPLYAYNEEFVPSLLNFIRFNNVLVSLPIHH